MREVLIAVVVMAALALGWHLYTRDEGLAAADVEPPLSSRLQLEVLRSEISVLRLPEADVRVTNNSLRHIELAYVDCAFFDASGALVATGEGTARAISPGGQAIETVTSADQGVRFDRVECRVSGTSPAR